MRDYIYIADSKVDSYFGQLSMRKKASIAAELGVSLGVLSAKFSSKREALSDRVERLELVEGVIRSEFTVSPFGAQSNWISETMTMLPVKAPEDLNLMFFVTERDNHVFSLGGSAHNIIGNVRAVSATSSLTHAPRLLDALEKLVTSSAPNTITTRKKLKRSLHVGVSTTGVVMPWTKLLDEISRAAGAYPPMRLTFLTRVLHSETWALTGKRYTLSTPLYVALGDV